MTCSNCNKSCNGNCGCQNPLTTPNYVLPECNNPETCSEVIDSTCVVYTGQPIESGDIVVVNTGDTVSDALQSIVIGYTNILPYKSYVANISINGDLPNPVQNVDVTYNNLGIVTWTQDSVDCRKFYATLTTPANNSLVAFISLSGYNIATYNYTLATFSNSLTQIQVDILNPDETCPTVGTMSFLIEIRAY